MGIDFAKVMELWTQPLGDDALARFARWYEDPVTVNGAPMALAALVDRARATQAAFAELRAEVITQVDAPAHTTVVFRLSGRHVGPLTTPLGVLPPTGRPASRQVIDLLAIRDGKIAQVWMTADELGALSQLGVLAIVPAG